MNATDHSVSDSSDNSTNKELCSSFVTLEGSDLQNDTEDHDVGTDLKHSSTTCNRVK